MATETLRIDITVEQKRALADLKLMDDRLLILQKQLKKTTEVSGIIKLQDEIRGLKKEMDSLSQVAAGRVVKGSNQAAFALTNLGRIAQDAPFGFIGIQNNLNPMLESFQRLQKETGSAGSALKAMASSLIGPAGLGLALSVGGALLVTFGDEIAALFKGTSSLSKANEELKKSIDGFKNSAAKEIISFKELASVAANANIPLNQRIQAVKDLQKDYPAYLSGLSQEDILAGKLGTAYDQIVVALKAKIALQAAEERLIPIIKEQLDIAEKIAVAERKVATAKGITNQQILEGDKFATAAGKINPFKGLQAEGKAAQKQLDELIPLHTSLENKIKGSFNAMQPFIQASNGLNLSFDTQKTKVVELKDAVANYIKELQYARIIQQQGMRDVSTRGVRSSPVGEPDATGNDAMVSRTQAVIAATQVQLDYANALRLTTMNEEAAAAMTNVAMSAFTSLGNAMLQGQDIGEALGNVFKKLIIDLTQMVVRALMFKAIMAALSGGSTAAADAASGGGGFMDFLKNIMGGAPFARDGGVFSGPKSGYPATLHGTEAVLNPKQFKNLTSNMMNLGALQSQGSNQSGGSTQVILRGQDLVMALQRAGVNLDLRRGN
jgi:hypothetical protein